jgi:tryptophanyl-tRNA synthetase
MSAKKLRSLTGVKPTGVPHIGNYLGAIRPGIQMSATYESFLFIADLHALTTARDPKLLREQTFSVAATWLACGLDPERVTFYSQTDVPETCTLAWILSCFTPLGLLNRAHSLKDARAKGATDEDINHGVYGYPVLMAADILLYDADLVPVGKDQKQHLEIAQEIARKVNNQYGEVLRVPEAKIDEAVMTIPGLDGRKMSKSYDNTIELFGTDKQLTKRVKQITTDSTEYGRPLSIEGDTLFQIHALFATDAESQALAARYASGRKDPSRPDSDFAEPSDNYFGWGDAKKALAECLLDKLGPVRSEYARLMADQAHLQTLLREGATKARRVAREVLHRVEDATGLVRSAEP